MTSQDNNLFHEIHTTHTQAKIVDGYTKIITHGSITLYAAAFQQS
jgi:hypothetical protein